VFHRHTKIYIATATPQHTLYHIWFLLVFLITLYQAQNLYKEGWRMTARLRSSCERFRSWCVILKYLETLQEINICQNIQFRTRDLLLLFRGCSPERTFDRLTHGRFPYIFRHLLGLHWTSDQSVTKASNCTRRHRDECKHRCGIRTHRLSIQEIKAYTSDRAATGTGKHRICQMATSHSNIL
jgi:hypothetical protein